MSTLRTAAQQALEALEEINRRSVSREHAQLISESAITALRAALAQQDEPVQEPVATLIAQRDALLEALKEMLEYSGLIEERCDTATTNKARAAIEAVEETK